MTFGGSVTVRRGLTARTRWLFVDGATDLGGHEVMLLRLLEELRLHGRVMPLLLCREGSRLANQSVTYQVEESLAAPGRGLLGSGSLARFVGAIRDTWCFAKVVLRIKPALCIVAEGCLLAQPVFVVAARLIGRRVVVYVPLVEPSRVLRFRRARMRDALVRRFYANLPDAWITITRAQAEDFAAWAGVRRPIFHLPNTVARRIDEMAQAHVPGDFRGEQGGWRRRRVLVLGRLEAHQKGLDILIDYLATRESLSDHLTLTFVGEGPFEFELRRRIQAVPSMGEWVSVRAWTNTVSVLKRHDVLLIPSRYEGVPLVMLEAMAMGVPVVASDLAGTRSFLPDSCLFVIGDFERAFEIVGTLGDPKISRPVIRRNASTYNVYASAHAFATSVRALTEDLRSLTGLGRKTRESGP
ncbi:MAG TPA: glycosyltransferase family 4 protein [Steroidobacteraceae bacterium]|nr:glycosyltransferase family 4 protein [Steroidobacteraceae bacterium]